MDPDSIWECDDCTHSMTQKEVDDINNALLEERENIPKSDLTSLRAFLKKAQLQLHPQHYIVSLTKRWNLALMCVNPAKAQYEEWQEKLKLVEELLEVLNIVNPGFSKDRGRALFELAVTKLNMTKLEYENHKLEHQEFVKISQNTVIPLFQECYNLLSPESEKSYEQLLSRACEFYIDKLKTFF